MSEDKTTAMDRLAMDTGLWGKLAPYDLFHSDVILTVSHILTEPTCPTVFVRFELPERAGMDVIASANGDTIEASISEALSRAREKLEEITHDRREILECNQVESLDDLPEAEIFPATSIHIELQPISNRACMLTYHAYADEVPQERAYGELSNRIRGDFVVDMAPKTDLSEIAARINAEISNYRISAGTNIHVGITPAKKTFARWLGLEDTPRVRQDWADALQHQIELIKADGLAKVA
ncbi:MAG: hypothetical protein ABJN42_10030 [Roseibium sp.]|uniref:hypothetical protein n=1 Tax=Roseibium sp. TaxID=1936156 RepID=UPI003297F704